LPEQKESGESYFQACTSQTDSEGGAASGPKTPLIVETEQAGMISAVVIDAVDGRIVGPAVPPPASGFSFTGPVDISGCSSGWFSWYGNARDWFNTMGYTSEAVQYPDQAKMTEEIQSMRNTLFYELAHGGSYGFTNGCGDSTSPSEVNTWLAAIPAVPFTFLGSCDGMCSTGAGTLSHAFRKGSAIGTSTVGYCGMSNGPASSCWYAAIRSVADAAVQISARPDHQRAFDAANADYRDAGPTPACGLRRPLSHAPHSAVPESWRIYVDVNAIGVRRHQLGDAFVTLSSVTPHTGSISEAREYRPKTDGLGRAVSVRRVYTAVLPARIDATNPKIPHS
jgi:hypothetical protein